MTPRTGRPPKESTRDHQYRIRLSDDELKKLDECARITGRAKADIIREGIDKVYQELMAK
ncbi:MAG: hypothetical protein M0P55_03595 [Clostridiales bacterium]|nr:hypothetical protein [Clostridiales bacterium]